MVSALPVASKRYPVSSSCIFALHTCWKLWAVEWINICAAMLQGLRVYEQQGKLLSSWQDQLSDTVQSQLQALFQSLINSFMSMARIKVISTAETTNALEMVSASLCVLCDVGLTHIGMLSGVCFHCSSGSCS